MQIPTRSVMSHFSGCRNARPKDIELALAKQHVINWPEMDAVAVEVTIVNKLSPLIIVLEKNILGLIIFVGLLGSSSDTNL